MADYLLSEGLKDWFFGVGLFLSFYFLRSYLLLDGIYEFDDGVDDAEDGGDDGDIETGHADSDVGLVGVVADVVHGYEELEDDHAGGVDYFYDDF